MQSAGQSYPRTRTEGKVTFAAHISFPQPKTIFLSTCTPFSFHSVAGVQHNIVHPCNSALHQRDVCHICDMQPLFAHPLFEQKRRTKWLRFAKYVLKRALVLCMLLLPLIPQLTIQFLPHVGPNLPPLSRRHFHRIYHLLNPPPLAFASMEFGHMLLHDLVFTCLFEPIRQLGSLVWEHLKSRSNMV